MKASQIPWRRNMKKYALPRPYVVFGEYLAAARTKAGVTQRDVSICLGYSSAQFISNFECGIALPPLKKLKLLVKLYDLPIGITMDLVLDAEKWAMLKVLKPSAARSYQPLQPSL